MHRFEVKIGTSSPLVGAYISMQEYVGNERVWSEEFPGSWGLTCLDNWLKNYEGEADISKVRELRDVLATALGTSQGDTPRVES